MAIDYEDLSQPDGQENNMGGTQQTIYYAPVRDFLSIKAPIAVPVLPEDAVVIPDTHTFKTGKCFKPIYCTLDKGSVEFNTQGERDGHSYAKSAKIFFPGAKKNAMGFAALIKNDKVIVEIPLADGVVVQLGSADFYAEFKPKFTSATNSAGVRGWEFEITSMAPNPYIYEGTITLTPAP